MSEPQDQHRIKPVDPIRASGAVKRLFSEIQTKFALVPNLFRVLANAPAALAGLMGLSAALAGGTLDEKTRARNRREQPVRILLEHAYGYGRKGRPE